MKRVIVLIGIVLFSCFVLCPNCKAQEVVDPSTEVVKKISLVGTSLETNMREVGVELINLGNVFEQLATSEISTLQSTILNSPIEIEFGSYLERVKILFGEISLLLTKKGEVLSKFISSGTASIELENINLLEETVLNDINFLEEYVTLLIDTAKSLFEEIIAKEAALRGEDNIEYHFKKAALRIGALKNPLERNISELTTLRTTLRTILEEK